MLLLILTLLNPGEDPPEIKAMWSCTEAYRLREPETAIDTLVTPSVVIGAETIVTLKSAKDETLVCKITKDRIDLSRTR